MTSRASSAGPPRKAVTAERIIESATALFAEYGFSNTSLQDIAEANGLTRSVMYHYFPLRTRSSPSW